MTQRAYDVIVAGVGAMGSAVCWRLAKSGMRVLGLERFGPGHAMGSSHGLSRIIRLAYYEGSHYVPLVRKSHELWRETEEAYGTKLLHVTGSLDIAPEGAGFVEAARQSCVDHQLAHETLSRDDIARRFPAFRLPQGHIGLWQPDGGFVASEKAIDAQVGLAQAHGADIHSNEPMTSWSASGDGVTVTTEHGTYSAGRLVIATGGWICDDIAALAGRVGTVRQAIGWFATRRPELFNEAAFPVFILTVEEGSFYGFPLFEHPGFKLGGPHLAREPMDPREPGRDVSAQQIEALRSCLGRYIPDAAGELLMAKGCFYTVSPDDHFIIDTVPGAPRVTFISACSGHGFKFASGIGWVIAETLAGKKPAIDLSPFSLARFHDAPNSRPR